MIGKGHVCNSEWCLQRCVGPGSLKGIHGDEVANCLNERIGWNGRKERMVNKVLKQEERTGFIYGHT